MLRGHRASGKAAAKMGRIPFRKTELESPRSSFENQPTTLLDPCTLKCLAHSFLPCWLCASLSATKYYGMFYPSTTFFSSLSCTHHLLTSYFVPLFFSWLTSQILQPPYLPLKSPASFRYWIVYRASSYLSHASMSLFLNCLLVCFLFCTPFLASLAFQPFGSSSQSCACPISLLLSQNMYNILIQICGKKLEKLTADTLSYLFSE